MAAKAKAAKADNKRAKQAREELERSGIAPDGITPDAIVSLSEKSRKAVSGAFTDFKKAHPEHELASAFEACVGEKEKRKIMATYLMRCGDGSLFTAEYTMKVTNSKSADAVEGWYYKSELKKNFFGDDEELTDAMCADMPSQPAEHKTAREKGYKQYFYSKKTMKRSLAVDEATTISHKQEISAESADAVAKDMQDIFFAVPSSSDCTPPHEKNKSKG